MRHRISLALVFCFLAAPAIGYAVADPQPMKPVGKDKRRTTHRDGDRDREDQRGGERDRARGWEGDRDHQRGPNRGPGGGPVGLRPSTRPEGEWVLGLTGDDTNVGVRVTSVVRGSAVERAGFERDDIIVNVGGYQVGIVDGRRYDMGEELQRQADRAGLVTLLVQNRRTQQLINVPVQLQWVPSRGRVFGRISYRERIALPPNAVCFVELVEVDRRGRPVRVLEKQLVRMGNDPNPTFQLEYDPRNIDLNRRYAVQARVEADGRIWMDTRDTYYVITQGSPERVDLLLTMGGHRGGPHRGGDHRGPGRGTRIPKR